MQTEYEVSVLFTNKECSENVAQLFLHKPFTVVCSNVDIALAKRPTQICFSYNRVITVSEIKHSKSGYSITYE